jgi:hypothetical protein
MFNYLLYLYNRLTEYIINCLIIDKIKTYFLTLNTYMPIILFYIKRFPLIGTSKLS